MPTLAELQSQDEQYTAYANAHPSMPADDLPQSPEQILSAQQDDKAVGYSGPSFLQKWTTPLGRVTTKLLDTAVTAADNVYNTGPMREARSATAGVMTGATNMADFVMSHAAGAIANAQAPGEDSQAVATDPNRNPKAEYNAAEPIWEHTKASVLDFRDAMQVQDPTLANNLTQSAAQLAVPYMGFSRALSGMHAVAQLATAGALTDATALGPHDMRMADMLALMRHTQGKLGDTLRTLAPDGSAVNAYINYLADRTNETEAAGRFKNVLDGFGVNLIATPLIHSAAAVLKQGYAGLRYMVDNGVTSSGGLVGPASQAGKIGWHGTPHDFNVDAGFDDSKIGSGEGAQAFGFGHYLAENPTVAKQYQMNLVARDGGAIQDAAQQVRKFGGDPVKAYKALSASLANETDPAMRARLNGTMSQIKAGNFSRGGGSLIQAEVDDKHVESMLDWDKPLNEQPEVLAKITAYHEKTGDAAYKVDPSMKGSDFYRQLSEAHQPDDIDIPSVPKGWGIVRRGDEGQQVASNVLDRSVGIPGIRYLDGGSRSGGEGTRNMVVFNGKKIRIVSKEK